MNEKNTQIVPELTDHDPEDGFVVTVEALRIGRLVRAVRIARHLIKETEEEFAARFNVSPETIFDWEFNCVEPPEPVVTFARSVLSRHMTDAVKDDTSSDFSMVTS